MKKLLAGFVAYSLIAFLPAGQVVHAQASVHAQAGAGSERHAQGLVMEHRGDQKGAFGAYLDAAEQGFPPAQRKLGEIYDEGNSAVARNYEESIRWYQKARENGEILPPQRNPMPSLLTSPKPARL